MPQLAKLRQQALRDLGVSLADPDEHVDRIVNLARTHFRSQHAALVLCDGDRIVFKSKAGFRGNPDVANLAQRTIDTGHPIVIGNTSPATSDLLPLQVGGAHMGFYGGYPIEAPDGNRIGVLCVFGRESRLTQVSDTIMLRDLAMMLQGELWATGGRKDDHG